MRKYRVRKDHFYVGESPEAPGVPFLCTDPSLARTFEGILGAAELASRMYGPSFVEAFEEEPEPEVAADFFADTDLEKIMVTSTVAGGTVSFDIDRVYMDKDDQHHPVLRVGVDEMNFGDFNPRRRYFNAFFSLSDKDCDNLLEMIKVIKKARKSKG